jgi:hypothetical protein
MLPNGDVYNFGWCNQPCSTILLYTFQLPIAISQKTISCYGGAVWFDGGAYDIF